MRFTLASPEELRHALQEQEVLPCHPYCFTAHRDSDMSWAAWIEARRWCNERFGDDPKRWDESPNSVFLCFRDADDAFEFRMRWC